MSLSQFKLTGKEFLLEEDKFIINGNPFHHESDYYFHGGSKNIMDTVQMYGKIFILPLSSFDQATAESFRSISNIEQYVSVYKKGTTLSMNIQSIDTAFEVSYDEATGRKIKLAGPADSIDFRDTQISDGDFFIIIQLNESSNTEFPEAEIHSSYKYLFLLSHTMCTYNGDGYFNITDTDRATSDIEFEKYDIELSNYQTYSITGTNIAYQKNNLIKTDNKIIHQHKDSNVYDEFKLTDGRISEYELNKKSTETFKDNLTENYTLGSNVFKFGSVVDGDIQYDIESAKIKTTDGKFGKSSYFDGDTQLSIASEIAYDDQFTISFWIKTGSTEQNSLILEISRSSQPNYEGVLVFVENGKIVLKRNDNSSTDALTEILRSTLSINNDAWNHIAISIKDGDTALYFNKIKNATSSTVIGTNWYNNKIIRVGKSANTDFDGFVGELDRMRIIKNTITQTEANLLHDESDTDLISKEPTVNGNVQELEAILTKTNDSIKTIEGGTYHSLAVTESGDLYVTGYNQYGQLGLGHNTNVNVWTKVQIDSKISTIAAGDYHSLVSTTDRKVFVTGYNNFGQLGLGHNTNVNIWTDIGHTSVIQVAAGDNHTLMMRQVGSYYYVYATGRNSSGQLGTGSTSNSNVFLRSPGGDSRYIRKIGCGGNYSVFWDYRGYLYGCGYNDYKQFGANLPTTVTQWTSITGSYDYNFDYGVQDFDCGPNHLIVKYSTYYMVAGSSNYYQCGISSTRVAEPRRYDVSPDTMHTTYHATFYSVDNKLYMSGRAYNYSTAWSYRDNRGFSAILTLDENEKIIGIYGSHYCTWVHSENIVTGTKSLVFAGTDQYGVMGNKGALSTIWKKLERFNLPKDYNYKYISSNEDTLVIDCNDNFDRLYIDYHNDSWHGLRELEIQKSELPYTLETGGLRNYRIRILGKENGVSPFSVNNTAIPTEEACLIMLDKEPVFGGQGTISDHNIALLDEKILKFENVGDFQNNKNYRLGYFDLVPNNNNENIIYMFGTTTDDNRIVQTYGLSSDGSVTLLDTKTLNGTVSVKPGKTVFVDGDENGDSAYDYLFIFDTDNKIIKHYLGKEGTILNVFEIIDINRPENIKNNGTYAVDDRNIYFIGDEYYDITYYPKTELFNLSHGSKIDFRQLPFDQYYGFYESQIIQTTAGYLVFPSSHAIGPILYPKTTVTMVEETQTVVTQEEVEYQYNAPSIIPDETFTSTINQTVLVGDDGVIDIDFTGQFSRVVWNMSSVVNTKIYFEIEAAQTWFTPYIATKPTVTDTATNLHMGQMGSTEALYHLLTAGVRYGVIFDTISRTMTIDGTVLAIDESNTEDLYFAITDGASATTGSGKVYTKVETFTYDIPDGCIAWGTDNQLTRIETVETTEEVQVMVKKGSPLLKFEKFEIEGNGNLLLGKLPYESSLLNVSEAMIPETGYLYDASRFGESERLYFLFNDKFIPYNGKVSAFLATDMEIKFFDWIDELINLDGLSKFDKYAHSKQAMFYGEMIFNMLFDTNQDMRDMLLSVFKEYLIDNPFTGYSISDIDKIFQTIEHCKIDFTKDGAFYPTITASDIKIPNYLTGNALGYVVVPNYNKIIYKYSTNKNKIATYKEYFLSAGLDYGRIVNSILDYKLDDGLIDDIEIPEIDEVIVDTDRVVYYISKTGSNSNDGLTIGNAFSDFSNIPSNSHVIITTGNYTGWYDTNETIGSEKIIAPAVFKGIENKTDIIIEGLLNTVIGFSIQASIKTAATIFNNATGIILRNIQLDIDMGSHTVGSYDGKFYGVYPEDPTTKIIDSKIDFIITDETYPLIGSVQNCLINENITNDQNFEQRTKELNYYFPYESNYYNFNDFLVHLQENGSYKLERMIIPLSVGDSKDSYVPSYDKLNDLFGIDQITFKI